MASKQLETISGSVSKVNAKGNGIQINSSPEWLNISQYHPISPLPTVGQIVEVQVEQTDRGVWINSLRILEGASVPSPSSHDRVAVRLAVLQAAATFAGGYAQSREEVRSSDVLKIADAWLAWIEQRNGGDRPA